MTWTFCRLDLCLETSVKFSINPTFCFAWSLFDLFFFLCKWFLCAIFFVCLFSSCPSAPLLLILVQRTQNFDIRKNNTSWIYSSLKIYLGLCVRKGDEEKKPYVLRRWALFFLHRTHHLSLDSQGIENFEVCRHRERQI